MQFLHAFVNGEIIHANQPAISAQDLGFLFGMGIFETLAVQNGVVLFLEEHLTRMENNRMAMRIPVPLWDIPTAMHKLLQHAKVQNAALRVTLTGGVAGRASLAITLSELPHLEGPVSLTVCGFTKFSQDPLELLKTTCRARNFLARQDAQALQAFDSIFLTENGALAEGSVCNIYMVADAMIMTPTLECGILAGVTREKIQILCQQQQIPFVETEFSLADLAQADEILISNSLIGIGEVKRVIDHWEAKPGAQASLTKRLQVLYMELVKKYCDEHYRDSDK